MLYNEDFNEFNKLSSDYKLAKNKYYSYYYTHGFDELCVGSHIPIIALREFVSDKVVLDKLYELYNDMHEKHYKCYAYMIRTFIAMLHEID